VQFARILGAIALRNQRLRPVIHTGIL
jgi:hypothetical protein